MEAPAIEAASTDPWIQLESGRWRFCPHDGQRRALDSRARFILVLAGWQSGKTLIGPRWLFDEIARCGPGDYLVASPTFALMDVKVVPEYRRLFEARLRLGTMRESPRPLFTFSEAGRAYMASVYPGAWTHDDETVIRFGHAKDPNSLESATYKAAHLDEPGQKGFKKASYETIESRVAVHQGRLLLTSRPYYIGWMKAEIYDRWQAGDPSYDVVNFRSIDNPAFPRDEYERQRRLMPAWKFRMYYDGRWERPAGMIYSNFSRKTHCIKRFAIPNDWSRLLGLDFGGVNTAGVFLAKVPADAETVAKIVGAGNMLTMFPCGITNEQLQEKPVFIAYRTYHAKALRTKEQHRAALLKGEPGIPRAVGGAWSEDQWRLDFGQAGLPVAKPPIKGVEDGIARVFALLGGERSIAQPAQIRLFFFDDLEGLIDDIESYSRALDESDEPTEKIENKEEYHKLDGLRYIAVDILDGAPAPESFTVEW